MLYALIKCGGVGRNAPHTTFFVFNAFANCYKSSDGKEFWMATISKNTEALRIKQYLGEIG
ncbi:MAG: hypothetical protein AAFR31_15880, partial [Cyanobacteria bacterium J06627_8]